MKTIIIFLSIYLFQDPHLDYSYPPMIAGSTWGNIYQQYFKLGDFDSMIKLTSQESIKKFGEDTIKDYYQSMDFGYNLKLKSWNKDENFFILNYSALINATVVIVRMKLTRGDTAKIVLPDNFFQQKFFLYK